MRKKIHFDINIYSNRDLSNRDFTSKTILSHPSKFLAFVPTKAPHQAMRDGLPDFAVQSRKYDRYEMLVWLTKQSRWTSKSVTYGIMKEIGHAKN